MNLAELNKIIQGTQLEDVTSEFNTGFDELPDGYYLSEVEKVELRETKETHNPMIMIQFKVVEDAIQIDDSGSQFLSISKTKGRKIFMNFVIKDEKSYKRFVSDMLKFENSEGEAILDKSYFTVDDETMMQALDALVGYSVYIHLSTTINSDDTKNQWRNLISWKRVSDLGLPQ